MMQKKKTPKDPFMSAASQAIYEQICEYLDKNPETTFLQVLDRLRIAGQDAASSHNMMKASTGTGMLTVIDVMRKVYERLHGEQTNES